MIFSSNEKTLERYINVKFSRLCQDKVLIEKNSNSQIHLNQIL